MLNNVNYINYFRFFIILEVAKVCANDLLMRKRILVLNGPNLGRLGKREPEIYGNTTLHELEEGLIEYGKSMDADVVCFQSNHEGQLIDRLEKAADEEFDGCILNAAALTHTSVALLDAVKSCNIPTVELHISNIHRREEFRKNSITAPACIASISGMGLRGYEYALDFLIKES